MDEKIRKKIKRQSAVLIPKDVVEYLEVLFPVQVPGPDDSIARIYFNAGQASVARHVRELYDKQKTGIFDVQCS